MVLKTAFDTTLRQDPGNLVLSFTLEMGMLFFFFECLPCAGDCARLKNPDPI